LELGFGRAAEIGSGFEISSPGTRGYGFSNTPWASTGALVAPRISFQHFILECQTFRIVFSEPRISRGLIHEDLEVVKITNLSAGIDVNPNGCHGTIL
jgi:hypothetical protein